MNIAVEEQVPLIWTTKGNLPEGDLRLEIAWELKEDYVKVVRRHWLGDELVKEGADILSFKGITGETVIGTVK